MRSIGCIKNYILEDKLLDWLTLFGQNYKKNINYSEERYFKMINDNFINDIISVIFTNISETEPNIDKLVYYLQKDQPIKNNIEKTLEYMEKGIPIINNAYLSNNDLYGTTIFLVRSDYLYLFNIQNDYNYNRSSKFSKNYHYCIVDIRNIKLNKTNNIINSNKNLYYKSQIILLSQLLANIQNMDTICSYCMTKNNDQYFTLDILSDDRLDNLIMDGLKWYSDLKLYGHRLNPLYQSNTDHSYINLSPNLCNKDDYPWSKAKQFISDYNKDITVLWNCNNINKQLAINRNIYRYDDPKLTSNILNKKGKQGIIIDKILSINKNNDIFFSPRRIKNYTNIEILRNNKTQFIVDFETTKINNKNITVIIGCLAIFPDKTYEFKTFIPNTYNVEEEEYNILSEWINYMYSKTDSVLIHHWGNAEKCIYNYILNKYNINDPKWKQIELNDMCELFKNEPIIIKGVYSYGLKEICKVLYNNNIIKNIWDDNDIDGKLAMIYLYEEIQKKPQKKLNQISIIKDIIFYNKIDCIVLYELLLYLKTKI